MTKNNNNYKLPELPPLEEVLKRIRAGGDSNSLEDTALKPENNPNKTREVATVCPRLKKYQEGKGEQNPNGEIKILVDDSTRIFCDHFIPAAFSEGNRCRLTGVYINSSLFWVFDSSHWVYKECPFAKYKA